MVVRTSASGPSLTLAQRAALGAAAATARRALCPRFRRAAASDVAAARRMDRPRPTGFLERAQDAIGHAIGGALFGGAIRALLFGAPKPAPDPAPITTAYRTASALDLADLVEQAARLALNADDAAAYVKRFAHYPHGDDEIAAAVRARTERAVGAPLSGNRTVH